MNREEAMDLAMQGGELLEDEQFEQAMDIFERLIKLAPMEPMGYLGKAYALVEMGHENEGLAVLDEAHARQPEEWSYLFTKVDLLESVGRYEEAKVAYRQAVELVPGFDMNGDQLGQAFSVHFRSREAGSAASGHAGEVNPLDPLFWFDQVRTLEELGHYEEALEVCDQVIADAPEWVMPWYKKVELLNRLGRRDEAEQAAQRIRALVSGKEAAAPKDEPDKQG